MAEPNANRTTASVADETVLVGREHELALFKKILKDSQPLLVVVTGARGVGKSSLLHAFQSLADSSGLNTAPSATSEALRITSDTTEESFSNQVQTLLAVPSGKSFIEKLPLRSTGETPTDQQPLLPIVQQMRALAPFLLAVDGYEPEPQFAEWFQKRFLSDLKRGGGPVVVAVAERPEGPPKLSPLADQIVPLGTLDQETILLHFKAIGREMSPEMKDEELKVYVQAAQNKPEMLGSLTRVLRLALQVRS